MKVTIRSRSEPGRGGRLTLELQKEHFTPGGMGGLRGRFVDVDVVMLLGSLVLSLCNFWACWDSLVGVLSDLVSCDLAAAEVAAGPLLIFAF